MELVVTVCDVCQDVKRSVVRYTLAREGRSVEVDLCTVHAKPVEALLSPPAPVSRPRRQRGGRSTTMEEIEAQKAARTRAENARKPPARQE